MRGREGEEGEREGEGWGGSGGGGWVWGFRVLGFGYSVDKRSNMKENVRPSGSRNKKCSKNI